MQDVFRIRQNDGVSEQNIPKVRIDAFRKRER